MDELAALRSFRNSVPPRDEIARERARRTLSERMHEPRSWRSRRGWVLAAAVLIGVVAVSSALGWTNRLLTWVAGEPAPPEVMHGFAVQNEGRARALPIFRGSPANDVIAEKAHGVIGIESSMGRVIMWAAPTRGGGVCWMVDIERARRPTGGASCSPTPFRRKTDLGYGVRRTRVGDRYLALVEGRVGAAIASVELRYADGVRRRLRVLEGFFLDELHGDSELTLVIGRDARGTEVARRKAGAPLRVGPEAVPKPVGPERAVIRHRSASGHHLTFSLAPGPNGWVCESTHYRGIVTGGCGPDLRNRVEPDEILITRFLFNEPPDGNPLVGLRGVVGEDVARLEIRYTDGTAERMPVFERFVFFEIRPEHHQDEAFVVVGLDAKGAELDRRVID